MATWIGKGAYLIWRAYENRCFDFRYNGEEWLITRVAQLRPNCIFDVGANRGEWLELCQMHIPTAEIHAFEIAPETFGLLQAKVEGRSSVFLNDFGLSDREGEMDIYIAEGEDQLTSACRANLEEDFLVPGRSTLRIHSAKAHVAIGDAYAAQKSISHIFFLKIDVEGMEESVLKGFDTMLSEQRIRLVQFEYNTTNIASKFLLRDAYALFARYGYIVGKLYPNYVDFREYHYRHEDFCGPNFVAVRSSDSEIIQTLSAANFRKTI